MVTEVVSVAAEIFLEIIFASNDAAISKVTKVINIFVTKHGFFT